MAWTEAELRAIAEGEAAADNSGVIPGGLPAPEHAAWRQGYARGWNGLGQPRQVDIPVHTFERDACSQVCVAPRARAASSCCPLGGLLSRRCRG